MYQGASHENRVDLILQVKHVGFPSPQVEVVSCRNAVRQEMKSLVDFPLPAVKINDIISLQFSGRRLSYVVVYVVF